MTIELTHEELNKCREFAYKSAQNQQSVEFGQSDTRPRSASEIGCDNSIGKIAEVAFAKMMLQEFGIKIELDFEYYPRGEWTIRIPLLTIGKSMLKGHIRAENGCLLNGTRSIFARRIKTCHICLLWLLFLGIGTPTALQAKSIWSALLPS